MPKPRRLCTLQLREFSKIPCFTMDSVQEFDPSYVFSTDILEIPPLVAAQHAGMWSEQSFLAGEGIFDTISCGTQTCLSDFRTSFPDQFGITAIDMAEPISQEFDAALCGFTNFQSVGDGPWPEASKHVENCVAFTSDCRPVYGAGNIWGIQENSLPRSVEAGLKVPRYSAEERKHRILKYLKKKNRRNFNKTIKYACRKTLADRRRRVCGRFASNTEIAQAAKQYSEDGSQIKDTWDEWDQLAMASLLYSPISAG